MAYVSILPDDVLQTLALQLNSKSWFNTSQPHSPSCLRFLRLPHPRTGSPVLFLPCLTQHNEDSILEIQIIDPPNPKSWFLNSEVIKDGKLVLMTPIDPAFLLIPLLAPLISPLGKTTNFRPADDIFEEAVTLLVDPASRKDPSSGFSSADIIAFASLPCVRTALDRVCDVKRITEEIIVYRYSKDKVVDMMKNKVERLLASNEFDLSPSVMRSLAKDGLAEDANASHLPAGRIRAACDLVAQYAPPDIKAALLATYNFTALDDFLKGQSAALVDADLGKVKAKVSKTTQAAGEDKKRKHTKSSHGVEKLKKADTQGMSKLSSYFAKV